MCPKHSKRSQRAEDQSPRHASRLVSLPKCSEFSARVSLVPARGLKTNALQLHAAEPGTGLPTVSHWMTPCLMCSVYCVSPAIATMNQTNLHANM